MTTDSIQQYLSFCESTFADDTDSVLLTDGELNVMWCNDACRQLKCEESNLAHCFNEPPKLPMEKKIFLGTFAGYSAEINLLPILTDGFSGYLFRIRTAAELRVLLSKGYIRDYVEALISRINASVHTMTKAENTLESIINGKAKGDGRFELNVIDGNCRLLTKKANELNNYVSLMTCPRSMDRNVDLSDILYEAEFVLKSIPLTRQMKIRYSIETDLYVCAQPKLLAYAVYNLIELYFSRRPDTDDMSITASYDRKGFVILTLRGTTIKKKSPILNSRFFGKYEPDNRNLLCNLTQAYLNEFISRYECKLNVTDTDKETICNMTFPAVRDPGILLRSSDKLPMLSETYDNRFHPLRIKLTDILDLTSYPM